MPRVIVTEPWSGLERCRRFLSGRAPVAARRAAKAIMKQFLRLEQTPEIGRPLDDSPEPCELSIPFGGLGCVASYRAVVADDAVHVLAFRHQREAGYRPVPPGLQRPGRGTDI